MRFERTALPDVVVITPRRFEDSRGYFAETFRVDLFEQNIGPFRFVQDNHSLSAEAGTVRGLHFQVPPKAQGKLIRCISGALLDVALDIRKGSPTYGSHVSVELTPENGKQLWVPPGFAHGFCTLKHETQVGYKVTDFYDAELDGGLFWNDPALAIDWPVTPDKVALSDKDRKLPMLSDLPPIFSY